MSGKALADTLQDCPLLSICETQAETFYKLTVLVSWKAENMTPLEKYTQLVDVCKVEQRKRPFYLSTQDLDWEWALWALCAVWEVYI